MDLVLAIGAFPGFLFAVIMGLKKNSDTGNKVLGLGMFFYSMVLLLVFLGKYIYTDYSAKFIVSANAFISLTWPLLYIYILFVSGSINKISSKLWIHLIPFAAHIPLFFIPIFTIETLSKTFYRFSFGCSLAVSFAYSIMMLRVISEFKKKIAQFYARENIIKFSWIKISVWTWIFINIFQLIFVPLSGYIFNCCPFLIYVHKFILNVATVSWIYLFAYFAISHPHIFKKSKMISDSLEVADDTDKKKEDSSEINNDYAKIISSRLENIMKKEKPYLDWNINIAKLGDMMNVQPYLLGKYINSRLGKNFNTYINELRLETVKSMFINPEYDDMTILEISLRSGFRSKSAFNSFFKKHTGTTPFKYRKKMKSERSDS
ncbi:MAG: helix-turn-helix domain-containing protein [bacterium]